MTWKMGKILISKPILLLPTIMGTFESVWYAQKYFPGTHGGRDVGNAFRHGAWNALVAFNCARFKSVNEAAGWAKHTTDMHEEIFPNDAFDMSMDLHNNRIGREVFKENYRKGYKKSELIQDLLNKCNTAVGVSDYKEIFKIKDELVYYSKTSTTAAPSNGS